MDSSRGVTIRHVAAATGFSTQTISRVINGRSDVAPATRQRVEEVMRQLGYTPNAMARSLSRGRSYTLGVVTSGLQYAGPARTLNGIALCAEQHGYTLILKDLSRLEVVDVQPLILSLVAQRVDGIIWAVPEVENNRAWIASTLPSLDLPVVFLSAQARPDTVSLAVDNYDGAHRLTQHLLRQGYRQIGHIAGPPHWWGAQERRRAWQAALQEAGHAASPRQVAVGDWSAESGAQAMRQLLQQFPTLDAVFAANDQMALGALAVAHELGRQIPAQLGIAGFDALPESAHFYPALTTVDEGLHRLGAMGVQTLVERIVAQRTGEPADATQAIVLKSELIVRASSLP